MRQCSTPITTGEKKLDMSADAQKEEVGILRRKSGQPRMRGERTVFSTVFEVLTILDRTDFKKALLTELCVPTCLPAAVSFHLLVS